jgi:hypothetical protein
LYSEHLLCFQVMWSKILSLNLFMQYILWTLGNVWISLSVYNFATSLEKRCLLVLKFKLCAFSNFTYWSDLLWIFIAYGISLGYGLDDRGSRVRFPARAGNFSLHHHIQNGSGAHPAPYTVGTRGSFPGGKAASAWSWPLTSI